VERNGQQQMLSASGDVGTRTVVHDGRGKDEENRLQIKVKCPSD